MPDAIYDAAVIDSAEIQPATATAWRKWLLRIHDSVEGVWVITYRKHTGQKTSTYEELVIEALCFGWIDSKPGAVDADRTKLYFTPRRKGSGLGSNRQGPRRATHRRGPDATIWLGRYRTRQARWVVDET